jgi:integrase
MPYIFTSLRSAPMTRRTVHHVVAEAAKAAGIEFPVHPHMLRHAADYYLANLVGTACGRGPRMFAASTYNCVASLIVSPVS